jgi:hypothetical protein
MKPRKGETAYSKKIEGTEANYYWSVRFDWHEGFVGITQFDKADVKDRVLLSPLQVRGLARFLKVGGVE